MQSTSVRTTANCKTIILALLSVFPLWLNPAAQAADLFTGMGDLPGGTFNSTSAGVSADGSVVVGNGIGVNGTEAFRWTQAGGMAGLGDLPGGSFSSTAYAVNLDGSVVVGYSSSVNGTEAFRWTQAGGMVGLGDLPGGGFGSVARGVSLDGSVVAGYSAGINGVEAFRWTQAGGMVGLGDLSGGGFSSFAYGLSGDGSTVVGQSSSANGQEAFRWTQASGMVGLGDLPGGIFASQAQAVNVNGSVVVGFGNSANGQEAFRWTQAGGMVGLGDLPGGVFTSQAEAVNADGSVVVGFGNSASSQEAFRWTQAGGMVRVADWLAAAGVSTTGFSVLSDATGVSASGDTVVGVGTSVNGTEAFIARVGAENGIVGLTDLSNSMAQTYAIGSQMATFDSLVMNGAHHRPLTEIALGDATSCGWVSGDLGRLWRQANGYVSLGEVGACHDFAEQGVRVGLGVGTSLTDLDLANNGHSRVTGQYGVAEVDWQLPGTKLLTSLLGIYGGWDADLTRGYAIAATQPSKGTTNVTAYSLRARVDWEDAFYVGQVSMSPSLAYTLYRTEVDAYQESGGSAPASFQDQNHTAPELRLGLTGKYKLSEQTTLLGRAEAAHRFDSQNASIQGSLNVLGVGFGFNLPGEKISQNWVRAGAEVDYKFNEKNLINASSFIATSGQDADISAALSWKVLF